MFLSQGNHNSKTLNTCNDFMQLSEEARASRRILLIRHLEDQFQVIREVKVFKSFAEDIRVLKSKAVF